jgi:outer membrane biosynthesis protein TonB
MPNNRIGGHYLAARNNVGSRRGTSVAMAMSVAISATILLLIDSPIVARAATIEEVARCRAIQINKERWDCFKALKAPKQNAPRTKRDDTPPSQMETVPKLKTEDVPKTKSEDAPKTKSEDAPKTKSEEVPKAKRDDTPPSQMETVPKAKTEDVPKAKSEDAPKTKSEDAPPTALIGAGSDAG